MSTTDWASELKSTIKAIAVGDPNLQEFAEANSKAVAGAITGCGPDSPIPVPDAGARAVFNIPAVHIPIFVKLSLEGKAKAYKNGYDLEKYRVGDPPPGEKLKAREIVDHALPLPTGRQPNEVYFAAVELNGSGIRFYGEICLVLKQDRLDTKTIILDRNSYDLIRAPLREKIEASTPVNWDTERANVARSLSGTWEDNLCQIAVIKVLNEFGSRKRRLTTGLISDAVLKDEDYIEILRLDSFAAGDLQEARVSAVDAGYEALVSHRHAVGPRPRFEALIWRTRRRRAEAALKRAGVAVKVVTTTGRVRA